MYCGDVKSLANCKKHYSPWSIGNVDLGMASEQQKQRLFACAGNAVCEANADYMLTVVVVVAAVVSVW
jgi:hypothetical protein